MLWGVNALLIDINDIQRRLTKLNTEIESQLNALFRDYPDINDFSIEVKKQYDLDGKAIFEGLTLKALIHKGVLLIYDKPTK